MTASRFRAAVIFICRRIARYRFASLSVRVYYLADVQCRYGLSARTFSGADFRQVFDEAKTVPFVVNGKKLGEIPVLSILP
jgi:hypothetical protein